DLRDDLIRAELLAEVVLLARDAAHAADRRLERQEDRSLEMQLRRGQLRGGRTMALEFAHFLECDVQHAAEILRHACGVDRLIAAVEVSVVKRRDGVGEAFLLANALKEPR